MKNKIVSVIISLIIMFSLPLAIPFKAQALMTENITVTVHYNRPNDDYDDWNLWIWYEGIPGKQCDFAESDEFGKVAVLDTTGMVDKVGFIIRKGAWDAKDIDTDREVYLDNGFAEIWVTQGEEVFSTTKPNIEKIENNSIIESTAPEKSNSHFLKTFLIVLAVIAVLGIGFKIFLIIKRNTY